MLARLVNKRKKYYVSDGSIGADPNRNAEENDDSENG